MPSDRTGSAIYWQGESVERRADGLDKLMPRDWVPRPSMPFESGKMTLHADTGRYVCVPAFELESAERLSTRQARKMRNPEDPGQAPT
jgi:hypothetical protein